ncbi:YciI family protein [Iamia sp. SCSIO 61187]|uniref:YciI family protein n=1 Tax=Iamia sp. SCSIO 61187 TaxID=2722752 RepID=UPI00351DA887
MGTGVPTTLTTETPDPGRTANPATTSPHAPESGPEEISAGVSIGARVVRGPGAGRYGAGRRDKEPQMKQYMLSVHHDPEAEAAAPPMSPEDVRAMYENVNAFNEEAQAADAMVFGCGLFPPDTATTVRTEGGELLLTDGPFAETKEYLGGFWIIKCADLDAALEWARKAADALSGGPIEVRPLQEDAEE